MRSSITVIAFGNVPVEVDVEYDNDDWECDGMAINGYEFEWQDVYIGEEPFIDYISDQIIDALDDVGWARGAEEAERGYVRRKEYNED